MLLLPLPFSYHLGAISISEVPSLEAGATSTCPEVVLRLVGSVSLGLVPPAETDPLAQAPSGVWAVLARLRRQAAVVRVEGPGL